MSRKVHRMLILLNLLKSRGRYDAGQLAEAVGVSERTIYRDMALLREPPFMVDFDEQTRSYRLKGECFLPPLQFETAEALAAVEALTAAEAVPFQSALQRARSKIVNALPGGVRRDAMERRSEVRYRSDPPVRHDGVEDHYETVREALRSSHELAGVYRSFRRDGQMEVLLEPYELLFQKRAWYVVGREVNDDRLLMFKLRRFERLRRTARRFTRPADFTLERYLGNAWNMAPDKPTYEIRVRFAARVRELVLETYWHKTQRITEHEDGSLTFQATVDGLNEVRWWVLGFGAQATVEAPEELREWIRQQARALLAGHDPQASGCSGRSDASQPASESR
jgi:predicted DNA-binding transcriptional regulator YafY